MEREQASYARDRAEKLQAHIEELNRRGANIDELAPVSPPHSPHLKRSHPPHSGGVSSSGGIGPAGGVVRRHRVRSGAAAEGEEEYESDDGSYASGLVEQEDLEQEGDLDETQPPSPRAAPSSSMGQDTQGISLEY